MMSIWGSITKSRFIMSDSEERKVGVVYTTPNGTDVAYPDIDYEGWLQQEDGTSVKVVRKLVQPHLGYAWFYEE